MSTHIVNWLLPEQQWADQLTILLGSPTAAQTCLSALMTPDGAGHLLQAHTRLLAAAISGPGALQNAAAAFASDTGPIFGANSPAVAAAPLEDPGTAAELLRATARTDIPAQLDAIQHARSRATGLRDSWYTAAILAAAGNHQAVQQVRAMAAVCRWAADSEERRKELRRRYFAAIRRWCAFTGADPHQITTADLLA
jgi:hypothetical protein